MDEELEQLKQQWQAATEACDREPCARTIGRLERATAQVQTAALVSIAESLAKLTQTTVKSADKYDPALVGICQQCERGNVALGPEHAEWCDKYVPF